VTCLPDTSLQVLRTRDSSEGRKLEKALWEPRVPASSESTLPSCMDCGMVEDGTVAENGQDIVAAPDRAAFAHGSA
jgi:hypothetical protein